MSTASRKAIKIIAFFVGLGAYLIWANGYYNGLTLQSLSTGFLMASAAYVAVFFFGLLSPMMGGLLALIGTVVGFFGIAWVMDKISASVSWLDDERMCWIFTGIATICMILDIRYIIRSLRQPKAASETIMPTEPVVQEESEIEQMTKAAAELKYDPQFVLYYAGELEKEYGRKPTTEEVLDRLSHLHPLDPYEIKR